jgi:hypothetical protein
MSAKSRIFIGLLILAAMSLGAYKLIHAGIYGLTIFVVAPVAIGALGSWIRRPSSGGQAAYTGAMTVLVSLTAFFALGWEGMVCIAMALPLAVPLGALGGWMAYRTGPAAASAPGVAMLLLLPSASLLWDVNAAPPIFEVHSAIEIAAAPETVWKYVVSFSDLPEPREWYFRLGLAYPERAHIEGSGAGAVRYCEFSTGPFVEPIQVWDQPHLLRFRVTQNPAPMHEWSPYTRLLPKHLHGYLVSKQGQFLLTPLPNGHTLLEGTTWYQHGLWPAEYWRWWSDAIIHRIHMRVLTHIRTLAEADPSPAA